MILLQLETKSSILLTYQKLIDYTSTDLLSSTLLHIPGNILVLVLIITLYLKTVDRLIRLPNRFLNLVDESTPQVLTNWVTLRLVMQLPHSTEQVTSSLTTPLPSVHWILSDCLYLVVLLLKSSQPMLVLETMKLVVLRTPEFQPN